MRSLIRFKVKKATSSIPMEIPRAFAQTKMTEVNVLVLLEVFLLAMILLCPNVNANDENGNYNITNKFATPCKTPNDDSGYCIDLVECELLAKFQDVAGHKNFLDESNCTPNNADPETVKVCCGRYANYVPQAPEADYILPAMAPEELQNTDPFPEECGKQPMIFPNRIFGGRSAALGEFPWLARLRHKAKNGLRTYGCAGFLIASKYVLTAAHCVKSAQLDPLGPINQVQLGEHNTRDPIDCEKQGEETVCADQPQLIRTGKPIVHPEYVNTSISQHHDIAIIPLKIPANLTDFVQPICLAQNVSSESEMWLTGWGKTEHDDRSPIKLKVVVRRASLDYCKRKYKTADVDVTSTQVCAGGEEGKDSCSGDSGGPLMVQSGSGPWTAEGIVSFGLSCGLEYWPGVYTNIPSYYDWITKTITRHWKHNLEKTKESTRN